MHLLDHAFTAGSIAVAATTVASDLVGSLNPQWAVAALSFVVVGFATIQAREVLQTVRETKENTIELITLVKGENGVLSRLNKVEDRERDRLRDDLRRANSENN